MNYFDQLNVVSWRGVPFAIDGEVRKSFGRDIAAHKIAGKHYEYEDTGAGEELYTVEAVIGGNEKFIQDADKFEELLSKAGTGRLVLPQKGEFDAIVKPTPRRIEKTNAVGVVHFSITFAAINETKELVANSGSAEELRISSVSLMDAVLTDFTNAFDENMPDFNISSILGEVENTTGSIASAMNRAGEYISWGSMQLNDAALFAADVQGSFNDLTNFEKAVDFSVGSTAEAVMTRTAKEFVLLSLSEASTLTDQSKKSLSGNMLSRQAKNSVAADLFMKVTSVANAAKTASYLTYESKSQAVAIRDSLLGNMQSLRHAAGAAGWTDTYHNLNTSMAAITQDTDERIGRLPSTIAIKPIAPRSSYSIAYSLFGDDNQKTLKAAQDIVARNKASHPSFIHDEELEVLYDVS